MYGDFEHLAGNLGRRRSPGLPHHIPLRAHRVVCSRRSSHTSPEKIILQILHLICNVQSTQCDKKILAAAALFQFIQKWVKPGVDSFDKNKSKLF